MFDLVNKIKGIFMIIIGIALIGYALFSYGNPQFNAVIPMSLFLITTGVGAISMGLSAADAKGLGILFMIATMLLVVYCFYTVVRMLGGSPA